MTLQAPEHLIDVATLQGLGSQPRIFDCTVHLRPDPPRAYRVESGLADYEAGHIPGAAFLDLQGQLSDNDAPHRFTRLSDGALAAAFGEEGVVDGADIVLYSSGHPMWATRIWWMLRALGVASRVLDGGLGAWKAAGAPLATGTERYASGTLTIAPRPELWADQATVLAAIGAEGVCTINALAPEVYRGDGGANYGRTGHITGSVNVPFAELFEGPTLCFADQETLQGAFAPVGALDQAVICYCGGGISATCDAFALTVLGHERVAVYDGSMSEWVADPSLPMREGAEP